MRSITVVTSYLSTALEVTKAAIFRLLILVFALNSTTVLKAETAKSDPEKELVWLSVNKEALKASLYTLPEYPKAPVELQSFRIAIGREKGDKVRQGDRRTPEGIYFTLSHVPEQNLLVKKYGRLAVPLDYPNILDAIEGKTGYGIWLHGAGDDNRIAAENVTEGCVAFYNDDIVKLKNWLVPQQGLVLISADGKRVNEEEDRKQVATLTEQWFTAWTGRDLQTYISFYSDRFAHEGRDKKAYEQYKARVFKSYQKMSVHTSTLRVLSHPKYAVAFMNQDFRGDHRYRSTGRKVLYWQKEAGVWKIIRETFAHVSLNKLDLSQDNLKSLKF